MKDFLLKHKALLAGTTACIVIAGITMSFQNTPFGPLDKLDTLTEVHDTIPEKTKEEKGKMSMKEFDKLMQNMDDEMIKAHKEVSNIDFNKIHQEINASLDNVNFDKIKMDLDKAMKEIDVAKIEQGIKSALKDIEWDDTNNQIRQSLQNAKREIEKIDMDEVKKEIEKAKLEIEKSKKELKKINIEEIVKNANAGIAKAKEELRLTKEMFNLMEKDGLIKQKDGFTIEYKDKSLFINGKKQSDATRDKYRPYFKGDSFKISISKDKE